MDIKEFLFNHRYIFIILVVLLFLSLLAYLILHFSGSNNKTISDVLDTNTPNIVKKLYCNDNLCLNNSSCVELLDDYKCICQYGYYGKNCNNYDIDEKEDEIDIDIYREEYIDRGRNRHHGNTPGPSPPGPVPIPATPFKYNCCNTTYECLEDPNGSYTGENALQDCNNNCKPPEPIPVTLLKYKCDTETFTCKLDASGTQTIEECQKDCKKPPAKNYSCQKNHQDKNMCVSHPYGEYNNLSNCEINCSNISPSPSPSPPPSNPCSNPCQNGGTCKNGECNCQQGWYGNDCSNGDKYSCNIEDNFCNRYSDTSCKSAQNGLNCCHDNSNQNTPTVIKSDDSDTKCLNGTRPKCNNTYCCCSPDDKFPDCSISNPCQNGGTCNNGVCTCTGGYTGDTCEINPVMYNCCKTTYTCEEHEDGIYDDIAKCSASCIKPITPPVDSNCYCDIYEIGNNDDVNNPSGYKLENCNKIKVDKIAIPYCNEKQCVDAVELPSNCGSPKRSIKPNKYYGITPHKNIEDDIIHSCGEDCAGASNMPFSMSNSTTIELCNMEKCNSPIKPSPIIKNTKKYNLQFMNNTGNSIYVSIVQSELNYYSNWNFYIGDLLSNIYDVSTPTNIGNVHYYLITDGKSLFGKPKVAEKPMYISGNAYIVKNLPKNEDFSYDGLTSLEFTYNNSLNSDISGVAGLNIDVDMEIFNGLDCNGLNNNKTICSLNNLEINCSNSGFLFTDIEQNNIVKCLAPGKGNNKLSIEGQALSDTIKMDDLCGDSNCAICSTGRDKCDPGDPLTDYANCYANNIKDRWGCYKWWGNSENSNATNWYDLFGDTCPIYRWPYDELKIKDSNNIMISHYNDFKINCSQDAIQNHNNCESYLNNDLYKCQKNGTSIYPGDELCKGKLEHNPLKPLVQCSNISNDTLLRFTINSVL